MIHRAKIRFEAIAVITVGMLAMPVTSEVISVILFLLLAL